MKKNMQKFNNIKEIIYHSASTYSNNIAFTVKNKNGNKVDYINHTYTDLLNDINCFGSALYKLGLKDKRVAVVGHNSYEWAVAHLSNLLGGIVSVPLDKGLQLGELENSLIRSQVQAVVFDDKLKDIMLEIKENSKTNIKFFICTSKTQDFLYFYDLLLDGKEILGNGNTEYVEHKIDSKKMSILLFTSGTTSKSKAVMLSNTNIASNVYAMLLVEDMRPTDNNLAFLPFHHIFGSTCMIVMIAIGAKTAFPDGLRYVAQNLKEYQISLFVGVPLLVEAIYKNIEKEIEKKGKTKLINNAKKLSNCLLKLHIDVRRKLFKDVIDALGGRMRFIISGGAPLDKKVAQGFNELGIEVVQGYGLTETSPVISAENAKKKRYGSIGFPMENVEVEIINKDENGIGEIRVKGPNVMLGYYENEEATKKVMQDGWFYTGDLAYKDKDGFIFLTGRQKDMIVLKNGKKVFPEELETLINRLDLVKECIVYGMPDEKDKNDLKLSVKIVYDKKIAEEKYSGKSEGELYQILWEKVKEINKTFPPYKYIKNMILTDEELIKTTTQKVKRNEEIKRILER